MAPSTDTVSTRIAISCESWEMSMQVTVPKGPTRCSELLPLVQSIDDAVVGAASAWSERQGQPATCRKGCGACCRQLVPITETEARHIALLIEKMPEPRRSAVQARFAEARARLADAGLLEPLLQPEQWTEAEPAEPGPDQPERGRIRARWPRDRWYQYFRLGLACPFLEEESCSIYADRPLACREFLVTSPAVHCADPTPETVRRMPLPVEVWPAMADLDAPRPAASPYLRWVPLVVAPEWAETHAQEPAARPGPELLQEFLHHLFSTEPVAPGSLTDPDNPPRQS